MRYVDLRRGLLRGVGIALAASLLSACADSGAYRKNMIETCKGEEITVGQMEKELNLARYNGPLGRENLGEELRAYNNAACGTKVKTCNGEMSLDELESQLRRARYNGPWDHGKAELAAYNRAACPERR
ncbi:MAG: hypothetical protein PHE48_02690 [Candidatus Daviesbacteria bacterium]|nr:hypothetical protein [Candidatus Daviesbacteria bacterium]